VVRSSSRPLSHLPPSDCFSSDCDDHGAWTDTVFWGLLLLGLFSTTYERLQDGKYHSILFALLETKARSTETRIGRTVRRHGFRGSDSKDPT